MKKKEESEDYYDEEDEDDEDEEAEEEEEEIDENWSDGDLIDENKNLESKKNQNESIRKYNSQSIK